ncbi:MAG: hypothetical protein M1839_006715 [Geoglossum umbratile]|nr:MAG: hypothetical protein M1839_006715 [Geoglossum umbratile]
MQREDEYELLGPTRSSQELDDGNEGIYYGGDSDREATHPPSFSYPSSLRAGTGGLFFGISSLFGSRKAGANYRRRGRKRRRLVCSLRRGWCPRRVYILLAALLALSMLLVIFSVEPSYTISQEPAHYHSLRAAVSGSSESGRGNPRGEKVFIAANIIDEDLIRGAWGQAVLGLIDVLGEKNVYLSIFENDSGAGTREALVELSRKVPCNSSIVSEHLPMDEIPSVILPSGRKRVKRVAYLAEVRNRALRPLNKNSLVATKFDKLLFINDVIFNPLDAAQLLFSTNIDPSTGLTRYRAACAVDFIKPFKFYDTFATRDLEGYSMGLPLFPWFANAGQAESRKDVLRGTDAVRVKSCWGGMVAFEAKWFQDLGEGDGESSNGGDVDNSKIGVEVRDGANIQSNDSSISPSTLRFRSEPDLFWDSSECCLINADLQYLSPHPRSPSSPDVGIYVNPFIRVAYSSFTFASLGTITRRFERALEPLQRLISAAAGLPRSNPRRTEVEGEEVSERVWVYEDENGWEKGGRGSFQEVKRRAGRGGFCGVRMLLVMKENPRKGERRWESLTIPPS